MTLSSQNDTPSQKPGASSALRRERGHVASHRTKDHSCVLRREHSECPSIRRLLTHPMHFCKNDGIPDKSCTFSGESSQVSTELKTQMI